VGLNRKKRAKQEVICAELVQSRKLRQAKDKIKARISLIQQPAGFKPETRLIKNVSPNLCVANAPE